MHMKDVRVIAVAVLASLVPAACAATGSNAEYKVVSVSYDYAGKDSSPRAWWAFMQALDQCHFAGYEDAQMAGPPERECKQGSSLDDCALFHVTLRYDCYGLGYQTSS